VNDNFTSGLGFFILFGLLISGRGIGQKQIALVSATHCKQCQQQWQEAQQSILVHESPAVDSLQQL
jgi:hypothetical protein